VNRAFYLHLHHHRQWSLFIIQSPLRPLVNHALPQLNASLVPFAALEHVNAMLDTLQLQADA